jgi:hypothetical protein
MRRTLTVLAVVAMMSLGTGVADAKPATYKVTGTWTLGYPDGRPTITPPIEDDVVEVTCRNGDQMTTYKVNKPELVAGAWRRTDGTGIQVQPEFTGQTETLRIRITCRRA